MCFWGEALVLGPNINIVHGHALDDAAFEHAGLLFENQHAIARATEDQALRTRLFGALDTLEPVTIEALPGVTSASYISFLPMVMRGGCG